MNPVAHKRHDIIVENQWHLEFMSENKTSIFFFTFQCGSGGCLIELCIQLAIIMAGKQFIQNNLLEIVIP